MEEQEWIVTLHRKEDLEDFYNDMETPGGDLYIPDRSVDLFARRPISRNTHYMLNDEEAEQLRKDPRVLDVQLDPLKLGGEVGLYWEQTGDFLKSTTINSTDKNWGLKRVIDGQTTAGWGSGSNETKRLSNEYITTTSSGKNVDVVIVDNHINPDHPEFAVNADGTGGSRVNQIDWFGLYAEAAGLTVTGAYDYSDIAGNHGTHVAGTACGNTQGWARDANIYNMEFAYSGSNSPAGWTLYVFDLLRAFHLNKPINPETGRRNPTITNHSWGYYTRPYTNYLYEINRVQYKGSSTYLTGLTDSEKKTILEAKGVPVILGSALWRMNLSLNSVNVDVQDAIDDGVIVVAAAGNHYWQVATPESTHWNNAFWTDGRSSAWFHAKGSTPACPDFGSIVVGNVSSAGDEWKASTSNFGLGVDIWAPGTDIISAAADTNTASYTADPRNSYYRIYSTSGTSMASPQVCGILACHAEQNPRLTQAEAKTYLINTSTKNQIGSVGSDYGDYNWFGDEGNNRYLHYVKNRPLSGAAIPRGNFRDRLTSGVTYPRPRIRRRG